VTVVLQQEEEKFKEELNLTVFYRGGSNTKFCDFLSIPNKMKIFKAKEMRFLYITFRSRRSFCPSVKEVELCDVILS